MGYHTFVRIPVQLDARDGSLLISSCHANGIAGECRVSGAKCT